MIYERTNRELDRIDNNTKKRMLATREGAKSQLNDAIAKIKSQYKGNNFKNPRAHLFFQNIMTRS